MSFDSPWRRSRLHEPERTTVRAAARSLRRLRVLRQKHALVVVEGVGGVHVPITSSLDVSDLIQVEVARAIVVGQSGLGGINHALLTLHALRQRNIPILALVLNQRRPVRTKTVRFGRNNRQSPCFDSSHLGSCGGAHPRSPTCESSVDTKIWPSCWNCSDHKAGEAGPSPHYS